MAGLPGTGKSTLVDYLGSELSLPVVTKDEAEALLKRSDAGPGLNSGWIAYDLLTLFAGEQLRRNVSVVIDSVAGSLSIRESWRRLADKYGAEFVVVECICSDVALHKQRLSVRKRNIEGWPEITWEHVLEVQSGYKEWNEERLVLDSADNLQDNADKLRDYLRK